MVCDKVEMEEAEEEAEEAAGYRIKNKNPTQRCGEIKRISELFWGGTPTLISIQH